MIPFLVEAARGRASAQWGPHLVFDDDGALVGTAGWKGEPVDGVAELGYAVAPARQGRGVATAVVRELLSRARNARLREVIAHTRPEASPSTSVLTRCGFAKVDEVIDPHDGLVWRWEVSLVDPAGLTAPAQRPRQPPSTCGLAGCRGFSCSDPSDHLWPERR